MRCEKSLFFSVVFVCVALLATFAQGQSAAPKARLTIRHMVKPAPQQATAAAPLATASTPGLPTWSFKVHSDRDGNNYTGVMVGKNPFSEDSGHTSVATQIVPIIFKTHTVGTSVNAKSIIATAPGDNTFNPTQPDRACLGSRNNKPLRLFQQSPIFQSADFNYGGTDVGRTQTTDAFQRANFWKVINREDYHVTLGPVSTFNAITVDVPAASGLALATTALGPPAFCAPMAIVDANLFDLFINTNILPALTPHGVNHGTFPIFLLYNAVLSDGDPPTCSTVASWDITAQETTTQRRLIRQSISTPRVFSGFQAWTSQPPRTKWANGWMIPSATTRPRRGDTPDKFPDARAISRWATR